MSGDGPGGGGRGRRLPAAAAATGAGAPSRAQPSASASASARDAAPPRLRILCLHGSRQSGEIFAARLRTLRRKLEPVADLVLVDAPHPAPRDDDDGGDGADPSAVVGRAFWRHWNLAPSADADSDAEPGTTAAPLSPRSHAALPTVEQRARAVREQLDSGWAEAIVADWRHSLLHLDAVLSGRRAPHEPALPTLADEEASKAAAVSSSSSSSFQSFHGVLGFSNGAAAAGLLAAHAAARAAAGCPVYGSLRFFVMAGGNVAEPRDRLVEAGLSSAVFEAAASAASAASASASLAPVNAPHLPFDSLHCIGEADPVIAPDDSLALAGLFDPSRAQVLRHGGGHHFPQRAEHAGELLAFLSRFAGGGNEAPAPAPAAAPPAPDAPEGPTE